MSEKPIFDTNGYQETLNKSLWILKVTFVWEDIRKYIEYQTDNNLWGNDVNDEQQVRKIILKEYINDNINENIFNEIVDDIIVYTDTDYNQMIDEITGISNLNKMKLSDIREKQRQLKKWVEHISIRLEKEVNTPENRTLNILDESLQETKKSNDTSNKSFRLANRTYWWAIGIGVLSLLANIVQLYIKNQ